MLHAMQQLTEAGVSNDRSSSLGWKTEAPSDWSALSEQESAPSPASPSFAGLLASLASPAQNAGDFSGKPSSPNRKSASTWNDDDLADDVATLSYESALKANARYRPTDQSLTQLPDPVPFSFEEAPAATSQPAPRFAEYPAPRAAVIPKPQFNRLPPLGVGRDAKEASITIRMSRAECAQPHRRAAEAGLTVSAYLRSCTFEVESLRAMVKDTLAQLRTVQIQDKLDTAAPQPRRSRFGWLVSLFTR